MMVSNRFVAEKARFSKCSWNELHILNLSFMSKKLKTCKMLESLCSPFYQIWVPSILQTTKYNNTRQKKFKAIISVASSHAFPESLIIKKHLGFSL